MIDDTLQAVAQALGVPLGAGFTGQSRLYQLHAEGDHAALASQLLVEAWTMDEALNALYELVISCVSANAHIDLDALLGRPLRLRTTLADGSVCWRSGYVSCAEQLDCDGGLSRYRFTLVPFPWLMTQMRDSAIWRERSFCNIIDNLYTSCHPLAHWRWSPETDAFIAQGDQGRVRPSIAQYRETHFHFAQRLLAAEGLNWRFEELDDAPLHHSQVLFADSASEQACPEDPTSAAQRGIRFHRANSQETSDAIQAFGNSLVLNPAVTTVLSWDALNKRVIARTVPLGEAFNDNAPRLERYEPARCHGDAQAADHDARIRREAIECRDRLYLGRSTVRSLRAGTTFTLRNGLLDALPAELAGSRRFLVTRVRSAGINNLPKELNAALARRWFAGEAGADLLPMDLDPAVVVQAEATGYGNSFEAQAAERPWRPAPRPKPEAAGLHSAVVVGPGGDTSRRGEMHVDRLDRIQVRFDWQRGLREDDRCTAWVPVAQWHAGAQMGCRFIPRIGQEVLVGFIDGDIDRPLVRGALYNGKGEGGVPATPGGQAAEADTSVFERSSDHQPAGQGNLAGGHSPAWHGAGQAQNNRAALSGIKTQELRGSGYNQLVFDDTDGQLRTQLGTTQFSTWLNLGHLIHQADNHRGSFRGLGWELRTDAYGALRAKQGLLISSYGTDPSDPAGDNAPTQALANQMVQLAKSFSEAAKTHQTVALAGHLGSFSANQSSLSEQLAPLKAMQQVFDGMVSHKTLDEAIGDAAGKSTTPKDRVPHTTDPVIGIAAKAGLGLVAGQDIVLAAGEGIHTAAGQDSTRAIGGAARLHTGQAIGVLAGAVQPGDEAAGTGITMIAGYGDVNVQAQSDTLQIAAKGLVNVQSANSHIDWAAAKKITLQTAGGAQIVIEGGGITVQCPGKITVHAATKSMVGAQVVQYTLPTLPKGDVRLRNRYPFSL
jgi:type VI secretion system secreted protein VgrG